MFKIILSYYIVKLKFDNNVQKSSLNIAIVTIIVMYYFYIFILKT